jgi:uncharacterized protein (TIGR02391 family)
MPIPSFPDGLIRRLSMVLGEKPFVGSEISDILAACRIDDTSGESTKWKRLYRTFVARQAEDKCANAIASYIETALDPMRWAHDRDAYAQIRDAMNVPLALVGLSVTEMGKIAAVGAARNLDEAHLGANRLRATLSSRNVHPEVLRHVSALILKDGNYFHAVFETAKGTAERIRELSGIEDDGSPLLDKAFEKGSKQYPVLIFNKYQTVSEINEHHGLVHLLRGLFLAYRNTTAHEPAMVWEVSEGDALDVLSLASLLNRRLDGAFRTTPRT